MNTIVVSAPGKVIIHGEHAVVYGKKALAGSLGLRTTMTLRSTSDGFVSVCLPVVSINVQWTCTELSHLLTSTETSYSVEPKEVSAERVQILKNFSQLSSDTLDTKDLAIVAFLHLFTVIPQKLDNAGVTPSIHICIESLLPPSAGLGSSAAFATCLAAGLLVHRGLVSHDKKGSHVWTQDELELVNGWAFIAEKIIHGRPSGIDNAVSTFGGALYFQSGRITPLSRMPRIRILLTNTRVGRSTKHLVENVRIRHDKYPEVVKPVLDSIEALTNHCARTLEQLYVCDSEHNSRTSGLSVQNSETVSHLYSTLEELIDMNHAHLSFLGVSHASLERVCQINSTHGLHTKLTGAGGGGCAFALIPPGFANESLQKAIHDLSEAGFDSFETTLGGEGVNLEVL